MSPETTPKLRAILVDDEHLARRYLRQLLEAHPDVEIVAECADGFEAVKAVDDHRPDLVFLDIQMPKLDGFEVLELIHHPVSVIFATAYDQYALKAFDAHAVDYLLKPFSPQRLEESLLKVKRLHGSRAVAPEVASLRNDARPEGAYLERVVIKDGAKIVFVPVEDIDYISAEDDYVSVHSRDNSWLKHATISGLEDALNPAQFVRIHRSTLVRVDRIQRIERETKDRYVALLKSGTQLAISRSGHKRLKKLFR